MNFGRWLFWQGMACGGAIFLLDRLTKNWVFDLISISPRGYLEVAPFFNIILILNKGISFGLFQSRGEGKWILLAAASAITVALAIWLWRIERRRLALAVGAVIGGAVGNLFDRLQYGGVADFLDFHILGYHWPAFNVADGAITIGVAFIILDSYLESRSENDGGNDIVN